MAFTAEQIKESIYKDIPFLTKDSISYKQAGFIMIFAMFFVLAFHWISSNTKSEINLQEFEKQGMNYILFDNGTDIELVNVSLQESELLINEDCLKPIEQDK